MENIIFLLETLWGTLKIWFWYPEILNIPIIFWIPVFFLVSHAIAIKLPSDECEEEVK